MDRFFLVYRLSEAHRKAALEKQKQSQSQPPQPQQQKNVSESLIKQNELIKHSNNNNNSDEAMRFEHDFSEWVYKMVNF